MRILILGDVVGRPGRSAVRDLVPEIVKREGIDLAIANAENSAGGMGVDIKSAEEMLAAGVHVLTSGNHIWKKKEIYPFLENRSRLIRPANYPAGAPGQGWVEWRGERGLRALVMNLQGRVFMPNSVDDPFRGGDFGEDRHGLVSRRPRLGCFRHAYACADGRRKNSPRRHGLHHRPRHVRAA